MDSTNPTPSTTPLTPEAPRSGSGPRSFALYLSAAVLGGVAVLAGAAAIGAFENSTSTTIVRTSDPGSTTIPAAAGTGLSVNEIYKRSGPGVVQVTATVGGSTETGQSQQSGQSLGSGFVIDNDGHIVTNYHVIDGATSIKVRFSNDDTLTATLVGSDPSTDLAVLDVDTDPNALTPLRLADSKQVEVGDPVVAIGNPFGLERTVTAGIVSALQRNVQAPNGWSIDHVIQTDAAINQGNSGGPLLNSRGAVIGVNSQIQTGGSGDGNVGIGFAVPSNTVDEVVAQILEDGNVQHSYLGVSAVEVTPDIAQSYKLAVSEGLLIQTVASGSGAAGAGLKAGTQEVVVAGESFRMGGDIIVAADGKSVTSVDELRDVIGERKPGDEIDLKIYRGGETKTVTVTLGQQPTNPSQ